MIFVGSIHVGRTVQNGNVQWLYPWCSWWGYNFQQHAVTEWGKGRMTKDKDNRYNPVGVDTVYTLTICPLVWIMDSSRGQVYLFHKYSQG